MFEYELFCSFVCFKTVCGEEETVFTPETFTKSSFRPFEQVMLLQISVSELEFPVRRRICFEWPKTNANRFRWVWELNFCFQLLSGLVPGARSLVTLPCRTKTVQSDFWTSADLYPELHKSKKSNMPNWNDLSPNLKFPHFYMQI